MLKNVVIQTFYRQVARRNNKHFKPVILYYQGGDTRREEVLSKVLVDISIHTTSHASDTAQNKLCSFWMGPVLLWSVINQKKDDLTIIDGSSLFKFVTER